MSSRLHHKTETYKIIIHFLWNNHLQKVTFLSMLTSVLLVTCMQMVTWESVGLHNRGTYPHTLTVSHWHPEMKAGERSGMGTIIISLDLVGNVLHSIDYSSNNCCPSPLVVTKFRHNMILDVYRPLTSGQPFSPAQGNSLWVQHLSDPGGLSVEGFYSKVLLPSLRRPYQTCRLVALLKCSLVSLLPST